MPVFTGILGAVGDLGAADIAATVAGDTAIAGGTDAFLGATGATGAGTGGLFDGIPSALRQAGAMLPDGTVPGLAGYLGQQQTNQTQIQLANQTMNWEKMMSDTAIQRRKADYEAAGYNPALAYGQGGASTPGGIMPTIQNPAAAGIGAASSAAQIANTTKQNELIGAQIDKTRADTVQSLSHAGQLDAQRDNIRQEMTSFDDRWSRIMIDNKLRQYDAWARQGEFERVDYDLKRLPEVRAAFADASRLETQAKIMGLQVPENVKMAAAWAGPQGTMAANARMFEPVTKSIANATSAATDLYPPTRTFKKVFR